MGYLLTFILTCFFIVSIITPWYAGIVCFGERPSLSSENQEDCIKCVNVGGLDCATAPALAEEDIDDTKCVKYAGTVNGVPGVTTSTAEVEDLDETKYFEPVRPGHSASPAHSGPTTSPRQPPL